MITYDYAVLDDAIGQMTARANQIIQQVEDQRKSVQQVLGNWTGSTADAYNKLCDDLEKDLHANVDILNNLRDAMRNGADEMDITDKNGGKHIYS